MNFPSGKKSEEGRRAGQIGREREKKKGRDRHARFPQLIKSVNCPRSILKLMNAQRLNAEAYDWRFSRSLFRIHRIYSRAANSRARGTNATARRRIPRTCVRYARDGMRNCGTVKSGSTAARRCRRNNCVRRRLFARRIPIPGRARPRTSRRRARHIRRTPGRFARPILPPRTPGADSQPP